MKGIELPVVFSFCFAMMLLTGCMPISKPVMPVVEDLPVEKSAISATPSPEKPPRLGPALLAHKRSVTNLVFSSDGRLLVSAGDDGSVILWDLHDPAAPVQVSPGFGLEGSRVRSVALSPDGKLLASSTSSGLPPPMSTIIWDISTPSEPVQLSQPLTVVSGFIIMYSLDFSPDGQTLAIGSENRMVTLWDVSDPANPILLTQMPEVHESAVVQVAFSPDGEVLASGDSEGVVVLWSMSDHKSPRKLVPAGGHKDGLSALVFSPDGKTLAVSGKDGVHLWDIEGSEPLALIDTLIGGVQQNGASLDFSPNGEILAGSTGDMVDLWDVSDRTDPAFLATLSGHQGDVSAIAFQSDGQTLASGASTGAIVLWNVSPQSLAEVDPVPPVDPAWAEISAVAWPLSPLSEQQSNAINECEIERLASEYYPATITMDDLPSARTPRSECDWAVLALAYSERLSPYETLSDSAKAAFSQAVSRNFGFALTTSLFYRYFDSISWVDAPAVTQQEITDVDISYHWAGMGKPVSYTVEIHQANTIPTVAVSSDEGSVALIPNLDREAVQALSSALPDLLPIASRFTLKVCGDNYPNWDVTLTFADRTTLNLTTDSNYLFFGGPWFTEIDHQTYMQFSSAFAEALQELVISAELPIGAPAAVSCFGDSVFDKAFP